MVAVSLSLEVSYCAWLRQVSTMCQEGEQKMMREAKVQSETARILLLLFLWDVFCIST